MSLNNQKIQNILNTVIGSTIGVLLGRLLFDFLDFRAHPDLYAMQSAPWYTSSLVYGVVALVVVAMALVLKLWLRKKNV